MMKKLRARRVGGAATAMTVVALVATACVGNNAATVAEETVVETDLATKIVHLETGTDRASDEATEHATRTEEAAPATSYNESATASGAPITCTWWHTGTEPLDGFWAQVASEFEAAHSNVTVDVQAVDELRDTLPTAIASGTGPDVFQTWGGGELLDAVKNGQVKDLTEFIPAPIQASAEAYRVDDGIYGMPYTVLPSGFWVNMNEWEKAGLTDADFPTTLDDLFARWATLKEAGVTPVAVGGADAWAAAHWWQWAALREVPAEAFHAAIQHGDFSDPGWIRASELVQQIIDQNAFNTDWQHTSAQYGADSASGMVVLNQAATQLMGAWDHIVMGGLYNEAQGLPEDAEDHAEFLRWFPFPAVPGAAGDEHAIMGSVDGFAVAADAPRECAELLAYIVSTDVQQRFAAMGNIPVDVGAIGSLPTGPLDDAAEAVANASSVQQWLDLDTALDPTIRSGMNSAIVDFMSGQGTPETLVESLTNLATGH